MTEIAPVIDKDQVREIVRKIGMNEWWTPTGQIDDVAIEQATNKIMALQRPPKNLQEIALTVVCQYCGRTPGNPCRTPDHEPRDAHPSRMRTAVAGGAA